uniref:Filamin A-interacting protein 1-like isoform X1 n=2 Tax=Castor canadensis TaxID=51338 RepID=A0A8C0XPC5_CASCN|nr:filamin A-interacting protein 1-like isoform X1 [Castor canadensis]XP_020013185.1 filamin A-interacting protein 1-like isoform X1 [Castor canadensis]XP_020013186.1 filamin A-interacting protein 1-like isoform X1 [Castor canadensis]XP_020013187.1 filamin A-interacting protein 1-like isoform X1 [Castor canadensis]XP_020013189.1 filamin A-interacting protein 1-like isoform X1 [Castor canadensis]XP_020013190.1 filamin A-interacting protein 1-like isoform X1 [Castor canadensis]XP_020013191.1 fi
MRARNSDTQGSAQEEFPRHSKDHSFQDMKHRQQDKDLTRESDALLSCPQSEKPHSGNGHQAEDLSRDDLLFLLSILEGELQARDEVIGILRAEKLDLALLEAQYGFVTPKKVLEALQRDAFQAKSAPWQEDIYEKPMNELDKVVEKHKESHRQILEKLLMVEKSHKQTILELEEEKRKHKEYMENSDKFISLLEQECERLKKLIDQETESQEKKEQEKEKRVTALKEELTKLKSFALMVVDEQQRLTAQLALQRQKIQNLTTSAKETQAKLALAEARFQEEKQKATRLEKELQTQTTKFHQNQEIVMAKLTNEDSQNRQLRQKLTALSRQIDELEETNRSLRKAEEELQDMKEKINKGEYGNAGIMTEVEELRKRVLDMEGKDEELIKMEEQCRDLNKRLEKETAQSKDFKLEVEKLNKRIMALEKLEDAFNKSKQECYSLKCNLEKERMTTKHLSQELESLKGRIKELEAIEIRLEKTEFTLKEDLTKLKTLTVMLVDERKTMSEKLKQTEDKLQAASSQLQVEQNKVTTVTEKLIEETKRALKSKTDVEEKMYNVTKERDDLKNKLKAEEEKGNDLLSKVNMLKNRLHSLEATEKDFVKNKLNQDSGKSTTALHQENNKIKELSQEVERLKLKLKDMKAIEDDLMKTEDEYETLERRYANERDKAQFLSEELEHVKMELAKYKLVEKAESSHEQWLFKRLQEEETKSGHLSREVDALKEKIHEYMATEDLICHLQGDHSILQKKLNQQENRNRDLGREIENLTKELERYRHFSKSLRPSLNGRRISDPQVFSKEVQTEAVDNEPPDYKSLIPLEQTVINGQLYESEDQDEDPSEEETILSFKCNSSAPLTVNRKLWIPWMKSKEGHPQNGKIQTKSNCNFVQPGDLVLSHTPGQPLHIKVTPDHVQNTATLEITSPTTESSHSYTSTAVIPNCGTPKQRITILQNASITPMKSKTSTESLMNLEQTMSPVTMATFATAHTPESCGSITPERTMSPIQVLAMTGSASSPEHRRSPEPIEISSKHAIFRVSPDGQSSWQFQRSNSNSSSVITTEDNKIHIHLGSPYMQAVASPVRPASPSTPLQDNRTQGLTNGALNKTTSKVTSSITITPTATPLPRQPQITVSNIYN